MHFRNHLLLYTLIPAILLIGLASYNRLIANHDYIVAYKGECNPLIEDCFVGCENDKCTEEYYYVQMQKYAADLYSQCGANITDCEAASMCLPGERACSKTYCDPEADGDSCEMLVQESEDISLEAEEGTAEE